jgi:drug/metabolite transporter (DMT)-like permease
VIILKIRGELLLVFITIIWGTTFAVLKTALESLPPFSLIAVRFTFATILGLLIFWREIKGINKGEIKGGIILGLLLAGGLIFQITGLTYTTAAKGAFLTGLAVVFVPFFDRLVGVKVKMKTIIAVVFAIIGTALLSFEKDLPYGINYGDILVLFCALCFAGYIFVLDKIANKGNTYCYTFVQIVVVGVIGWIFALIFDGIPKIDNPTVVLELLYLALFATILSTVLQTIGQKKVSGQRAAIIFTLEPVFGVVFAYLLLGETLTYQQLAGCIVIFSAILYNEINGDLIKTVKKGAFYDR